MVNYSFKTIPLIAPPAEDITTLHLIGLTDSVRNRVDEWRRGDGGDELSTV